MRKQFQTGISLENSGLIAIKFCLKQPCGGGKAAFGFGPDRIRFLVSMSTNLSHRVVMGEMWQL